MAGDTTGLPNSFEGSCGFGSGASDTAVEFTASATTTYVFTMDAPTFDGLIAVLDTCGGVELGCNDSIVTDTLAVPLTAGQTVIVEVDGWNRYADGEYELVILPIEATELICDDGADHDGDAMIDCDDPDCAGADACDEGQNCTDGLDNGGDWAPDCEDSDCAGDPACAEPCPDAVLANVLPASAFGSTTGQTSDNAGSCGASNFSEDLVYEFTAPATASYEFNTVGSAHDTVLYLRDGCGGPEIACNDDDPLLLAGRQSRIQGVSLVAGQTITIVVDGTNGSDGAYTLNVFSRVGGVALDLASQPADGVVHGPRGEHLPVAPDGELELVAGDHPPRVGREVPEERDLEDGELDRAPVTTELRARSSAPSPSTRPLHVPRHPLPVPRVRQSQAAAVVPPNDDPPAKSYVSARRPCSATRRRLPPTARMPRGAPSGRRFRQGSP